MPDTIIELQIGVLRKILSKLAENDKNGKEDFIQYANNFFGFDTQFGWNILMNSFYVFEDTELAKKEYSNSGISGSRSINNLGENYLRLYGILNTFYQQFLATINLMELFKLKSKKEHIKSLRNTECIILRNKIAAHPSNYSENKNFSTFDVYEVSRSDLERGRIELLRNQEFFETYDLDKAIILFNKELQLILSLIIKKFLKKKFNNEGQFYTSFKQIELKILKESQETNN